MRLKLFTIFVLSLLGGLARAQTPVTACGTLSSASTTYKLQNNISSTGTCITLGASNITLDLNGFNITYDSGNSASVFGITTASNSVVGSHITSSVTGAPSVAGGGIYTSTVCKINLQTQANTASGCDHADPISVFGDVQIDHVLLVDYGLDNEAIRTQSGGNINIHDNLICPYHTLSTLNHFAVFGEIDLTNAAGGPAIVNNNTIGTSACQSVIGFSNGFGYVSIYIAHPGTFSPQLEITNNNISMASAVRDGYGVEILCVTNSSGAVNFEIANNTINQVSARGIIVDGENTNSPPGCGTGTIHDNTITVKEAGNEGNSAGDSIGIQARFGASNVQIYNNTVTVPVGAGQCPAQFFTDSGSDCGGIGIKMMATSGVAQNLTAFNNTVTATSTSASFVAAGLYGDFTGESTSFFKNNNVSSNSSPISVDPPGGGAGFDGCGRFWLFQGNTITKLPNPQGYFTFTNLWFCTPTQTGAQDTTNNVFLDNTYSGGASPDDIGPTNTSGTTFSYYLKWSYNLTVTNSGVPVSNASVTAVATGGGSETVSGTTNASGQVTLVATQHFVSGTSFASQTTTNFTPHNLTIAKSGCTTLNYTVSLTATTNDTRALSGSCVSIPNIYIAQSSAGTADGSSCVNAVAATFFNTAANWGAAATQIGSGTTVHLCGIISTTLVSPASQGTGLITITFEPGAMMQQAAALNFFSITNKTNSYLITGQSPCGSQNHIDVACTEKIQNTANGSPTSFPNSVFGVKAIDFSGSTGSLTVQNLEISNLYVHTDPNDQANFDGAHLAIGLYADLMLGNMTIQDSVMHDNAWAVSPNPRQGAPNPVLTVARVNFYNNDHDIALGSTCNPACYSVVINGIHSHDHRAWNTYSNQFHHDGIHIFGSQNQVTSALLYNSLFDGPWDQDVTGPMFDQSSIANFTVFNNVYRCDTTCTGDPIALWQYGGGPNHHMYNNTFLQSGVPRTGTVTVIAVNSGGSGATSACSMTGNATCTATVVGGVVTAVTVTNPGSGYQFPPTVTLSGGATATAGIGFSNNSGLELNGKPAGFLAPSSNVTVMNTIADSTAQCFAYIEVGFAPNTATSGLDYNICSNYITSGNKAFNWTFNGVQTTTDVFATWQGLSGEGTHSSMVASANLDPTGKPQAGSPAIGVGANLTSLCVGALVPLCTDYAGVSRPASGPWTIGAFQVSSSSPIVVFNPTTLTFASQLVAVPSSTQAVTLTNNGPGNVVVSSVSITGTNGGDFSQTNTCGTVAQGNTCTITVTFNPTATGSRTASVSITDNATGSPQSIPLTGTAVLPTLSPASMAFGSRLVGSSVLLSQAATLTNPSSVPLSISSITIPGAVDPQGFTDFTQTNNCGASLAGGNSCTITVTFTPHVLSAMAATLTVAHNAGNSPQTMALSGTGIGNLSGTGAISGSGSIIVKP